MEKFIYVFDEGTRDILIKAGYSLLRCDEVNALYVFANEDCIKFSFSDVPKIKYLMSNILTF